ncbi:hypothetical protein SAMN04488156_1281 [Bacillus sp. 166amftsu]|nr:hypothetical protein SAMN04488156_1281 [Bacillus sp. 166amftsu]
MVQAGRVIEFEFYLRGGLGFWCKKTKPLARLPQNEKISFLLQVSTKFHSGGTIKF